MVAKRLVLVLSKSGVLSPCSPLPSARAPCPNPVIDPHSSSHNCGVARGSRTASVAHCQTFYPDAKRISTLLVHPSGTSYTTANRVYTGSLRTLPRTKFNTSPPNGPTSGGSGSSLSESFPPTLPPFRGARLLLALGPVVSEVPKAEKRASSSKTRGPTAPPQLSINAPLARADK